MTITGNEPAHPTLEQDSIQGREVWNTVSGLTIRQQFSAMAMQGYVSALFTNPETMAGVSKMCREENINPTRYIARMSVEQADLLIEELNREA